MLRDAEGQYDKIICCGDVVGYGADPNATTEWARASVSEIVRGNHDKACVGLLDLDWFNPAARLSAIWSLAALEPANAEWLRTLPRGPKAVDSFQIFHGSPLDEDEYIVAVSEAEQAGSYLERSVSFFGHTHMQGGFLFRAGSVSVLPPPKPGSDQFPLPLNPDHLYLINAGAVGQPRDGDPRAAYAIYEPDLRLVTYRRVEYDVSTAQRKIIEAGLPRLLADRLSVGR